MIRRPPRSTRVRSSAASDVYKRQVTMFSFGAGQGLSEHTAPYDAFVQVVDGEAEAIINGEPHTVAAGQMIIMPANIPHELKAVKPFKMLLVMLSLIHISEPTRPY